MDSSKCQTLTATPAEPGELPTELVNTGQLGRTDLPNLKQDAGFAPVRSVFSRTVAGQRTMHLRLTGRHPSGIGNLPNGTFKVGHDLEP